MRLYIDTLALLYRAYYAIPDLRSHDGAPTGALFGLTKSIFKIALQMEPEYIIACFDRPEKTIRQEAHADYKENREMPEEDMIQQIEAARDMLRAYGIPVIEQAGYEADDLIGTLAVADAEAGDSAVIVTCDGDLLQLTVHDLIRVCFLQKGVSDFILYDMEGVEKRNGYPAKHIIDYKSLAGDSSDNIKGVPGIGDVFAKRLIHTFGDLDSIYAALEAGSMQSSGITTRVEDLLLKGRESAYVSRDLATIDIKAPLSLKRERIGLWRDGVQFDEAKEMLERYSFESLIPQLKTLVGHKADADPVEKKQPIVTGADVHALKEAAVLLWILDSNRVNASIEEVFSQTGVEDIHKSITFLEEEVKKARRLLVWEEIERPLIAIIKGIEEVGVRFDVEASHALSEVYQKDLTKLSGEIYQCAGREFNINSPKQLSEILYTDLGLKPTRASKGSSGIRTTKESTLLQMVDSHPIISFILKYRHYEKLRSTYISALPKRVGPDGRLHTSLQQNGTTTGRLSSRNPNLQNIPIGGEDATAIRNLFIAEEGWELLAIDYSQIELRIAALLSQDKNLIEIFSSDGDVHTSTASRIFSLPEDEVTSEQRQHAKVINFGILYGMGIQSLRQSIKVSLSEAEKFIVEYKKAFPGLFEYMDTLRREAKETGFVTTPHGRVRQVDGINSKLAFVRSQAERIAINSVIQGTAADVIKLAMIKVDRLISKRDDVRMILQIHDELLFEVKEGSVIAQEIARCMESISVPSKGGVSLTVSLKRGKAWGSMSSIK